jgi:hypothetical protein
MMHSNIREDISLSVPPDCLLSELDEITAIIANTKNILCLAEQREKQLMAALDCLTVPPIPLPLAAMKRKTIATPIASVCPSGSATGDKLKRGYDYRGETVRCYKENEIWIGVMTRLLQDFPDKQAAIQQALKLRGRKRIYLARSPMDLFPGKGYEWIKDKYVPIQGGWFVDKNFAGDRLISLVRAAIEAVGLTWGLDVVVRLYSDRQRESRPNQPSVVNDQPVIVS